MVRGSSNGVMELPMKEILRIIILKASVNTYGLIIEDIKDSG